MSCRDSPKKQTPIQHPAYVNTVLGPLPAQDLGTTLIHEHLFLDWSAADEEDPSEWQSDSAFAVILPFLEKVKGMGLQSLFDCTPKYIGRNPILLKELSEAAGIQIVTNTGYYGARNDLNVPAHAYEESADQLAQRWIKEFEEGIEGTGIKPGFIKIGVDGNDTLSTIDEKLVRAAARTHLATGLTIVAHTGPDEPARREVSILEEEGVAPGAWVWTHAQNGSSDAHLYLASKGAWISLDGMGYIQPENGDSSKLFTYIDNIENLKQAGFLNRTLIAHDGGWYTHGEQGGGDYTPHEAIFTLVIPAMKRRGFTEQDIKQLMEINPAEAFTIRVRDN